MLYMKVFATKVSHSVERILMMVTFEIEDKSNILYLQHDISNKQYQKYVLAKVPQIANKSSRYMLCL